MGLAADRFKPDDGRVAAEVIDGEAILIDLVTGTYYSMDGVGGLIWSLIARRCDTDTIVARVTECYDVPDTRLRQDIAALVEQLIEEQLVLATDEPEQPAQTVAPIERAHYSVPTLNKYRDMSMLLAVDPPMPGITSTPWQAPKAIS